MYSGALRGVGVGGEETKRRKGWGQKQEGGDFQRRKNPGEGQNERKRSIVFLLSSGFAASHGADLEGRHPHLVCLPVFLKKSSQLC